MYASDLSMGKKDYDKPKKVKPILEIISLEEWNTDIEQYHLTFKILHCNIPQIT